MEWNGGWWLLVVEWWHGGCTKSCLCVSCSGVFVMIQSLGYVGVHQEHHDHGRPYARTIGFSTEMVVGSLVFEQKCITSAHETMVFVLENARRWRVEVISLRKPTNRQPFLSNIQRTALLMKIDTLKPSGGVHEPLVVDQKWLPEHWFS